MARIMGARALATYVRAIEGGGEKLFAGACEGETVGARLMMESHQEGQFVLKVRLPEAPWRRATMLLVILGSSG